MPKKKKQTVWHKRREKFVPSSVTKPNPTSLKGKKKSKAKNYTEAQQKKIDQFKKNLRQQVRKAVKDEHNEA